MDYASLLTNEQKKSILEQRIAQFAAEAYQHEINKKLAGDNEEAIKAADDALAILDNAIKIHQDEIAKLEG
jgi:phage terminase small subunit